MIFLNKNFDGEMEGFLFKELRFVNDVNFDNGLD